MASPARRGAKGPWGAAADHALLRRRARRPSHLSARARGCTGAGLLPRQESSTAFVSQPRRRRCRNRGAARLSGAARRLARRTLGAGSSLPYRQRRRASSIRGACVSQRTPTNVSCVGASSSSGPRPRDEPAEPVSSDELAAAPRRFLMCTRGSYGVTKLFDKIGADRVALVWSLWRGYWEREDCAMRRWAERRGVEARPSTAAGTPGPRTLTGWLRRSGRGRRAGCTRTRAAAESFRSGPSNNREAESTSPCATRHRPSPRGIVSLPLCARLRHACRQYATAQGASGPCVDVSCGIHSRSHRDPPDRGIRGVVRVAARSSGACTYPDSDSSCVAREPR